MKAKPEDVKPVHVSDEVWFYPMKNRLEFVVECRTGLGTYHRTIQFHVSAKRMLKALESRPQ